MIRENQSEHSMGVAIDIQNLKGLMNEHGYETTAATIIKLFSFYEQPAWILWVTEFLTDCFGGMTIPIFWIERIVSVANGQ